MFAHKTRGDSACPWKQGQLRGAFFKITTPQTNSIYAHARNNILSQGGYMHANVLFSADRCFMSENSSGNILHKENRFLNGHFESRPCFPSFAIASDKHVLLG